MVQATLCCVKRLVMALRFMIVDGCMLYLSIVWYRLDPVWKQTLHAHAKRESSAKTMPVVSVGA